MPSDLFLISQLAGAIVALTLMGINIKKHGMRSEYGRNLFFLLLIYLLTLGGDIYARLPLVEFRPEIVLANWDYYGFFLGSVVLHSLSLRMARRTSNLGYMVGLVWFAVVIAAHFIPAPEGWWYALGYMGELKLLIYWLLVGGWAAFVLAIGTLILRNYQQNKFPTVRNRLFIWGLVAALLVSSNLIYARLDAAIGSLIMFAGAAAATYVVLTPRLPHLGTALRRMINAVLLLIIEFIVFATTYLVFESLLQNNLRIRTEVVAALFALSIILAINPLLQRVQNWANRLFFGEETDINKALRDFSQHISNILDLELLSTVVVNLVREILDIDRGMLFLVELEISANGQKQFRITQSRKARNEAFSGALPGNCALATTWNKERLALTQAEIEMLPRFNTITDTTREWLSRLDMDLYLPIHAQDEWVGLLALGPKASGASFFSEDIELLHTLADQTAVALQNTRLVESLMRINREFRRAYSAMEEAHTKLQRIDRTKSDFISIASHELRTPLTILSGYSQMLLEAPELQKNKNYADFLHGIYDGTQRLHEIVENLLEVAKIDLHELSLSNEPVNLHTLIQQVVQNYAKLIRERELDISIDASIGVMPAIPGDAEALGKVWRHLLSNAVKYTPDGGAITFRGRHLPEGDARMPQGGVEIAVQDTGIGIDPRYKDLIFAKFYQTGDVDLHSSSKTKFKGGGPGLGLAIVQGIVEAHGGRVWAESDGYDEEKLPGSTFYVLLPLTKKENP